MDLSLIKFDEQGLVPAIAQDAENGEVLMQAYMNIESLRLTLETGKMTYWSRSRQQIWVKGASSGHAQEVVEFRIDCDGDALLFKVRQEGGACHIGFRSCFFRRSEGGRWAEVGKPVFRPEEAYRRV